MIIAVDFDGSVVKNKWPDIGRPRWLAISVLRWLNKRHDLVLYTCREGRLLQEAYKFLTSKGIMINYINQNTESRISEYGGDCRKISADLYIDDKAVGYWNWLIVFILVGLYDFREKICMIMRKRFIKLSSRFFQNNS